VNASFKGNSASAGGGVFNDSSGSPLITPAPGSTVHTARPLFDWTDGVDNVGVFSYSLLITQEALRTVDAVLSAEFQVTTTASQYRPDWDLPNGDYTWSVRAYDAEGNASPWAAPQGFAVDAENYRVLLPVVLSRPLGSRRP
jgi:hypothetical protein